MLKKDSTIFFLYKWISKERIYVIIIPYYENCIYLKYLLLHNSLFIVLVLIGGTISENTEFKLNEVKMEIN